MFNFILVVHYYIVILINIFLLLYINILPKIPEKNISLKPKYIKKEKYSYKKIKVKNMRRKNKQERLPLEDNKIESPQEEVLEDLKQRIYNLTSNVKEEQEGNTIKLSTRDMVFVSLTPKDDHVEVVCNLPYDRILDMSRKCIVKTYAAEDNTDIVTYNVKTKFDIQYAVSIVQQSFIYRKRLKL